MSPTIKRILLTMITIYVIMGSCDIRDENDDCGVFLKFIFDYNMEFADSFDPQVRTVDVYIFDENGKYLYHRHADSATDLVGRDRMYLSNKLPLGIYKLITVGGLSDHFRFTDLNDNNFVVGLTTIQEVKLALYRQANEVSYEFSHLWFGKETEIQCLPEQSLWFIHLIRNTNNFHVVLHDTTSDTPEQTRKTAPYTFEIVTPEGAVYGYDNNPLKREKMIYSPFYLGMGEEEDYLSVAKLNTMRLFADDPDGYHLIIRSNRTGEEVWSYDLMQLLRNTKPYRPDGTAIPLQEYLDRQGEWNIVILYRIEPDDKESFIAVKIIINGWIIWENDIEI